MIRDNGICSDCSLEVDNDALAAKLNVDLDGNVGDLRISDMIKLIQAVMKPISSSFLKLESKITAIDTKVKRHDKDIAALNGRLTTLENNATEFNDVKSELEALKEENTKAKKSMNEQQKFLESSKRESIKKNVFISGLPNTLTQDDDTEVTDNDVIVQSLFEHLVPGFSKENYKIIKAFKPREGYTRHSSLVSFIDNLQKKEIMDMRMTLKDLPRDNLFSYVYLKHEEPPMTHKENTRLYGEFKKLRDLHQEDETTIIKLEKGKLYENDEIMDEFNLTNQNF